MDESEIKDLVNTFLNKIYSKGLFKEADDSEFKNLISKENGVSVISLWMCGVQIITISKGEETKNEYRQVSFTAHTDEPYTSLYLRSIEGDYQDAVELINQASERFKSGSNVMRKGEVGYASIVVR